MIVVSCIIVGLMSLAVILGFLPIFNLYERIDDLNRRIDNMQADNQRQLDALQEQINRRDAGRESAPA